MLHLKRKIKPKLANKQYLYYIFVDELSTYILMAETEEHLKQGTATLKPISQKELAEKLSKKAATPPVEKSPTAVDDKGKLNNTVVEEPKIAEPIKTEAKAEGEKTEVKEETKPAEEAPKTKLRDKVKPFSKVKPPDLKAEGEVVISPTLKAKLEALEQENLSLKKRFEDPEFQIIEEAKKSNKDIFDVLKEIEGTDPKTIPAKNLWEDYLKSKGIEGDKLTKAMDAFDNLEDYEQDLKVSDIRDQRIKDKGTLKEDFLKKLREGSNQAAQETQKNTEQVNSLKKGIADLANDYIGQEHLGVVGTPQMAESIKNYNLADLIFPKKEDGTLDDEKVFRLIHYALFGDMMIDNLENQNFAEGFNKLKKDVEVTKGASTGIVRTPQGTTKPKSEKELVSESMSKMRPVSIGHQSIRQ